MSDMTENWVAGLRELINIYKQEGVVKPNVDSDAIARGLIALRDGLYGSLDLGADVGKVRSTLSVVGSRDADEHSIRLAQHVIV